MQQRSIEQRKQHTSKC